jgi:hypothetical protein
MLSYNFKHVPHSLEGVPVETKFTSLECGLAYFSNMACLYLFSLKVQFNLLRKRFEPSYTFECGQI